MLGSIGQKLLGVLWCDDSCLFGMGVAKSCNALQVALKNIVNGSCLCEFYNASCYIFFFIFYFVNCSGCPLTL